MLILNKKLMATITVLQVVWHQGKIVEVKGNPTTFNTKLWPAIKAKSSNAEPKYIIASEISKYEHLFEGFTMKKSTAEEAKEVIEAKDKENEEKEMKELTEKPKRKRRTKAQIELDKNK